MGMIFRLGTADRRLPMGKLEFLMVKRMSAYSDQTLEFGFFLRADKKLHFEFLFLPLSSDCLLQRPGEWENARLHFLGELFSKMSR